MNRDRLSALLTLLQDDDPKIASLAMEQFLELGRDADQTIAEHQESRDPRMRHRIHQLSSIIARRRMRDTFVSALATEELSLWEGIVLTNSLYDPSCRDEILEDRVRDLRTGFRSHCRTTAQVAALMRDKEFTVPAEEIVDADIYLIRHVLETGYGSAAVLCVLAQHVAGEDDWHSQVVLHGGRFCLMDRNGLLVNPSEGWQLGKIKGSDRVHPCSRRDVLVAVLCQLFLAALIDGNLREIHHFGTLLTALNANPFDVLPFPLGDQAG